jgi:hypothetical protein
MNDAHQFGLFKETILPDLKQNIVCGNSLIGRDIMDGSLFPVVDEAKLKPMNFEEVFPKIMKRGGFDAVVGNPPYIRIQILNETLPESVPYYSSRYKSAGSGNYDVYVIFVERGLQLLGKNAKLGFILPNKFLNAQYGRGLRQTLASGKHLAKLVHFGDQQVFASATTYTSLLFLNRQSTSSFEFERVDNLGAWQSSFHGFVATLASDEAGSNEWNFIAGAGAPLITKLTQMPNKLSDLADRIFQGLITGADGVFLLTNLGGGLYQSESTGENHRIETDLMHPLCKGSVNIRRYEISGITKSILFPYRLIDGKAQLVPQDEFQRSYPLAWKYLAANRKILEARERGKWKHERWYAFGRSQNLSEMEQSKILTPSIAKRASFTIDQGKNLYFVGSGGGGGGGYGITLKSVVKMSPLFVVGVLNSRVLDWLLKSFSSTFQGGYFAYNRQYIEQLPIRTINFSDSAEKAKHDKIVMVVEQMLQSKEKFSSAKTDAEKNRLELQCESLDRQIDEAVYELYGLTAQEIRIVEGK